MTGSGQCDVVPQLSIKLVWSGFTQMILISLFVAVFGAAFGLAATQAGLSEWTILTMSAFVFAGASQFATLELWGAQLPVFAIAITVFAINARHLLMGASLYPYLQPLPVFKRYGVMVLVSDANWALSMQMIDKRQPALGVMLGGGLALWVFWLLGTWLGMRFGNIINQPQTWGLDMVMGCFLFAMALSGKKDTKTTVIWTVAALSSVLAYWYLPENSHVIAGALAGGLVGAIWETSDER